MLTTMKLILWDIDGTILLTPQAGMRSMLRAGRALFGHRFGLDGVDLAGRLDGELFLELTGAIGVDNPAAHHDAFRAAYFAELEDELVRCRDEIREMHGVRELVAMLSRERRCAQGVVTGNYETAAALKLRAIEFDRSHFGASAFGDEAPDRPGLVRLAVQRHRETTGDAIAFDDVIVIGDTPRDVECANANGCVSFAVATGHHSAEALRACGADHVVDDFRDASPLLSLLG